MRALGSILALLLLPSALLSAASLQVFVSTSMNTVVSGNSMTVEVLVKNNGATQVNNAIANVATVQPYGGATGALTQTAGPLPSTPALLIANASVAYTFIYQGTNCGDAAFSVSAEGQEEGSGITVTAEPQVANITVLCPSPTPTPTPWIVYQTATPGPSESSAGVRGNVFRPGSGPMQLDFAVAFDSPVTIRIFDRNGKVVRTIKREVSAGRWTEDWDGTTDSGDRVSTGIYIVHFQAKGLNQRAKVAVIK